MLSVVEDFNKLKKYNIESILGVNNAGIPEQPKKKETEEKVETEKVETEEEVKAEIKADAIESKEE